MDYKTNPNQKRIQDIEDLPVFAQKFIDKITFQPNELEKVSNVVKYIFEKYPEDNEKLLKLIREASRIYKIFPSRPKLLRAYRNLVQNNELENDYDFMHLLINKPVRSSSGVLVVTVFTSPYPTYEEDGEIKKQKFSCNWNCYYCPNEPDQPRSYLLKEPGVMRANQNNFDVIKQFNSRIKNLEEMGHPIDKLEILILGGTWESYPKPYREQFIRDIFFAANTIKQPKRKPLSLEDEIHIQSGQLSIINKLLDKYPEPKAKIIGITIETRPDTINAEMIKELRKLQITRLQIGVQHTDNDILKKINRQCTIEDAEQAFQLLKDNCFKIDIHLMPDLPGSNPEKDLDMFNRVLTDSKLQVDQWKIYPCETVPWTIIKKWHEKGEYIPYGDEKIVDVLCEVKNKVHPWIRLNRVVRDIPDEYIIAGNSNPGLRSMLPKEMEKRGYKCRCIRCREIGNNNLQIEPEIKVRTYDAQNGTEFFISLESPDENHLFGFVRLRITNNKPIFPELTNCTLIRELHIYGNLLPVNNKSLKQHSQHRGYGTILLKKAEEISKEFGFKKIAVISGTGVRKFYHKKGYRLHNGEGGFMIKNMENNIQWRLGIIVLIFAFVSSYFLRQFSPNLDQFNFPEIL